ncbi:hypothetical protein F4782DRAFT_508672 [Xylaria castorea]|nr:hypothetical protein F4782DRAFT_508672 [Xylaria castorea]
MLSASLISFKADATKTFIYVLYEKCILCSSTCKLLLPLCIFRLGLAFLGSSQFEYPLLHNATNFIMPERVFIPLERTPLLAGSEGRGYSTIKPRLRVIIPPKCGHLTEQITSEDTLLVTMDEETSNSSNVLGNLTPCTGTAFCMYCLEQGLDHNLQAYHQRGSWRRFMERRRIRTAVDIYIWFCLHLLCVIFIMLLILLFRVYIHTRLDKKYPGRVRPLMLPWGSGQMRK